MPVLLYIIFFYLLVTWVVLPMVVPNLWPRKKMIIPAIPDSLSQVISNIKKKSMSKEQVLQKAYDYVTDTYEGSRTKTLTRFWEAFVHPFTLESGFMHCTGQNYILRVILLESGYFSEDEIKTVLRPLNFFIHQCVRVRLEEGWVDIDPWAKFLGVPYKKSAPFIG